MSQAWNSPAKEEHRHSPVQLATQVTNVSLSHNGIHEQQNGVVKLVSPIDQDKPASPSWNKNTMMEEDVDVKMNHISISPDDSHEMKDERSNEAESSRSSTTPPISSKAKPKPERKGPQLIGHLPRAEEAAFRTFVEIQDNHYQYGTLGRSREALESMTCECQFDPGVDSPEDACGDDCINRLTQVECMPDACRCYSYCRNQRFQRKEYAPIEIVQTEMKGFGLRAAQDLKKDAFIYEYVGDVVSHPSFLKRMRQYAEEGIRHFYFMMLQKDEFIDATKRGGIGRFANHSCNPNCYVAKWTVGEHVRMGIFANRNIKKDEELTFNYNVDRYGHDAQPCYCGEEKCVGFIGGKTQTDLAAMDDLYLDALGISDEVEQLGLKGSKKKKGKKLDEDFVPDLKPLVEKDVPKVVQAMRQTQSRKVLLKLLTRIKLTEDQSALRQLMRLRGFSVMNNILEDYNRDLEIMTLAIECMMTWPLIQRNKVEDSKIDVPVKVCAESDNEVLAELAKKLLAQWEGLEYAYRIPKRLKGEGEGEGAREPSPVAPPRARSPEPARPYKRSRTDEMFIQAELAIKPLGFSQQRPPPVRRETPTEEMWSRRDPSLNAPPVYVLQARPSMKEQIAAVIAAASETALSPPPVEEKPVEDINSAEASGSSRKKSSKHKHQSTEEKEANKEKRLLKLIGAIVVKCMSKYQKQMDHDLFKKHAKELTHIIAEKEKKSSSYKEGRLDTLSDEKVVKIKKFAKEYIAKIIRKLEKAGQRHKPSSTHHDSSAGSAPPSASGNQDEADESMDPPMSVEEAMGFDDNDGDNDDRADEDGSPDGQPSPEELTTPQESFTGHPEATKAVSPIGDPRIRHRNEEWRWDADQDSVGVLQGPGAVSVGS